MDGDRATRVIVGVDDSLAGLRALRLAVAEARRRGAVLHAVRAYVPSVGWSAELAPGYRQLDKEEKALVASAFAEAMGAFPEDVPVVTAVLMEWPAAALVAYADRDDDLLFVGTSQRRWPRRLMHRSVSRYCVARARCPVVVVPADAFAKAVAREGGPRALRRELPARP